LITYALAIGEETLEGIEPSYSEDSLYLNSSNWLLDMYEEMENLHNNGAWDLYELLKGCQTLIAKWIYKRKEGIHGVENARWKARLVVRAANKKKVWILMRFLLLLFVIPVLEY